MVRADVTGPTLGRGILTQATIKTENGILNLHGSLANPCESRPELAVNMDSRSNTLVLDVVTLVPHRACSDASLKEFDISYDLKELPLTVNGNYDIAFSNSSIKLKYNALKRLEGFEYYRVQKQSFTGTLVDVSATEEQNSGSTQWNFALRDGDNFVPVVSPDLDLVNYKNGAVSLAGYAIKTAVALEDVLNSGLEGLAPSSQTSGAIDTVIVPVSVTRVVSP